MHFGQLVVRLAALGVLSLASFAASAQAAWPARTIRWIVPYTPGGITDNATRMVMQKVQEKTGWQIIVDNKPGANSMLGADLAAKASPDGCTFVTVIAAHAANQTLYQGRMPFDAVKSFAPVSLVGIAPLIMTASNGFPPKDAKELTPTRRPTPARCRSALCRSQGRGRYDDGYIGLAASLSEGERLASVLGDIKLERACRAQVLAMSTGRPLALLDEAMVKKVEAPNPRNSHSQTEREALYFAAMMRVLDRETPGYAD